MTANDTLVGGSGNDIFVVQTGNDTVQGNGGINTLVLDTTLAALKIAGSVANFVITYGEFKITTSDIDFLATKDGIFAIAGSDAGVDSAKAALAPGHHARLQCRPRPRYRYVGPRLLVQYASNGGSLRDLANGSSADEFAKLFGNPKGMSDTAFVEVLYKNVLDRAGEAAASDTGSIRSPAVRTAVPMFWSASSLSAETRRCRRTQQRSGRCNDTERRPGGRHARPLAECGPD